MLKSKRIRSIVSRSKPMMMAACLIFMAGLLHAEPLYKNVILIIESYHEEYSWSKSYRDEIEKAFSNDFRLEFFRMDTKRLPKERHEMMGEAAWQKYLETKPVLVFLGDDAALKYLGPKLSKTSTPVVYLGINNNPRDYLDINKATNITGVLERPLLKANFNLIKSIYPNAKNVLVLFDTDLTSKVILKETFDDKTSIIVENLSADLKLIGTFEEWKKEVGDAPGKYDVIIAGLYHTLKDNNGNYIDSEDVIRWTSASSKLPIFGFWQFSIGSDKAIGGLVISGAEQGKAAVSIAQKILSGTPPVKIFPVIAEKGRFLFSKSQLQKRNITLPEILLKRAEYVQ